MGKAFEVTMDTSRINATLAALHSIVGGDFKDVVRSETQKILEKAVSNTPVVSVEAINTTQKPSLRAQRMAARGLLKKVWVQIGEKLNMTLQGTPDYVKRATGPNNDDHPENAEGNEKKSGNEYSIDGVSYRVYDPRIVGAFASAMNGRKNFFRANLRKGVFDEFDKIAAKYPGLYVNRDV